VNGVEGGDLNVFWKVSEQMIVVEHVERFL